MMRYSTTAHSDRCPTPLFHLLHLKAINFLRLSFKSLLRPRGNFPSLEALVALPWLFRSRCASLTVLAGVLGQFSLDHGTDEPDASPIRANLRRTSADLQPRTRSVQLMLPIDDPQRFSCWLVWYPDTHVHRRPHQYALAPQSLVLELTLSTLSSYRQLIFSNVDPIITLLSSDYYHIIAPVFSP